MVINREFLEAFVAFFASNKTVDLSNAMQYASDTWLWVKDSSTAQLEYSLENHKKLKLTVSIAAPKIVVPLDVRDELSPFLHVDAGTLLISSTPTDESVPDAKYYDRYAVCLKVSLQLTARGLPLTSMSHQQTKSDILLKLWTLTSSC